MQAYEELLKHNHIMHTIDLRLRCSNDELKLIGEHVFRNLSLVDPLKVSEQKIKIENHLKPSLGKN